MTDIRALATRFFDAIEAGDIETVQSIYAPDAIIWHNTDNLEQPVADNLATLTNFIKFVPERRYEQRRIDVFDGGFVEQHLLKGKLRDGKNVSLSACIICKVANGRITRLDEYFDSAALAAWR
ncbi:MAG: nuclear transport factor 2 family protein [Proteobacteria bacterium]|nr:nuclear transport factor 2 family protein [Pseudomonadota bacterium]